MRDLLEWLLKQLVKVEFIRILIILIFASSSLYTFFMSVIFPAEVDRLTETSQKMFGLSPLSEEFNIDENDFVHGLPKGRVHLIQYCNLMDKSI